MITLSLLARTAKLYALDSSISDEEFLNALLEPLIQAGRIKNKMGAEFRLDKCRTSKILAGKSDVPQTLKKSLARVGIEQDMAEHFELFLEEYFDQEHFEDFCENIARIAKGTPTNQGVLDQLNTLSTNPPAYFARCLILAIKANNLSTSSRLLWQRGAATFVLETGDLLDKGFGRSKNQKDILVIPVNTGFNTKISWEYEGLSTPLVSANTLHGQWLSRMHKTGESAESIHSRIYKDLYKRGVLKQNPELAKEPSPEFDVGTIAVIENSKAIFYLLAISAFDPKNNAQSQPDMIKDALDKLFEYYDTNGQGMNLYLPLIGTGMSRAHLTHGESFELITKSIHKNYQHILGRVTLVVRPDDVSKLKDQDGGMDAL